MRGESGGPSASAGQPTASRWSASRPSSPREFALPPGTYRSVSASLSSAIDRRRVGRGRALVTEPALDAIRDDRRSFLRCRRRALSASGGIVVALGVLAGLFVAPNRLASLRVGDV